jgi:Fic family protein
VVATFFHLRFIRIHPFGDGNGRMARIGTNLVLMLSGYMPLVVRQEDKQEYYRALNQSSTEDVTPLALFFGAALIRSLELMLRGARGESIEDSEDWKQQAKEIGGMKAKWPNPS